MHWSRSAHGTSVSLRRFGYALSFRDLLQSRLPWGDLKLHFSASKITKIAVPSSLVVSTWYVEGSQTMCVEVSQCVFRVVP